MYQHDMRIRPGFGFGGFGGFGRRRFGFGFPLGFLGGLALGAAVRPYPFYPYPYPYPYYPYPYFPWY
ncbi:hypothetical protein ACWM35_07345 [Neobacillus sp. K501]